MQNFLKGFLRSFSRYRHGKGFGIHSPFAYRFITEVLRQPYAYYAYLDLKDADLRLIVRVLAFVRPDKIEVYGDRFRAAVSAAAPHAAFVAAGADIIVTEPRFITPAMAARIAAGEVHAIVIGNGAASAVRTLAPQMRHGMTFCNGNRRAVIAAYPHLPRQDFQVRF